MHRVTCSTRFDITATQQHSRRRNQIIPFQTESGQLIDSATALEFARNQQRNWETVNQIIALRALPEHISDPVCVNGVWTFSFDVPDIASVAWGADPVGALRYDANNVPMAVGLLESGVLPNYIVSYGEDSNIWFQAEQLNI